MAQSINIKLDLGQCVNDAIAEIWKWGQVNRDDSNYQRIYNMQFDQNGASHNTDRKLLWDYVRQRAERIPDFVSEYLTDVVYGNCTLSAVNQQINPFVPAARSTDPHWVEYTLTLPAGWNSKTFQSLAQSFTDYAVAGAVADWFTNIGEKQGGVFEQKATNASTAIIRNIYHKNSTI